ncbi:MAG: endolytic transglycosylase MltG [Bacteroidales bacterium]|nr:endolytic transglycosylase MltG [Bacteroidales bacterium]
MPKTKRKIFAVLAVVGIIVSVVGLDVVYSLYTDYYRVGFKQTKELYVYPNTTAESILEELEEVAYHPSSLERSFERQDVAGTLKPGHYTIEPAYTAVFVSRMLSAGWQTPVNLVLSGTLRTKGEIARKISRQMMMDSLTVIRSFSDTALLHSYGREKSEIFSMFLPDTYEMYWTAGMKDVFDVQKKALDAFWTPNNIVLAQKQGLTPMEATILASIVKGESNHEPEYPQIAGVYLNRLHKGMKLQADPTVAFCYGYTLNRILKRHLKYDSPYNTYKYAGLPPAPICVPTKACLEAVLHPDPHNYMFFCASPAFDGTHLFAKTYSEHQKNARAFQKELNARHKAKSNK